MDHSTTVVSDYLLMFKNSQYLVDGIHQFYMVLKTIEFVKYDHKGK